MSGSGCWTGTIRAITVGARRTIPRGLPQAPAMSNGAAAGSTTPGARARSIASAVGPTKVFNTFEGGAIICPDIKTKVRIDRLKNFGHVGEVTVVAPGINGKMSEFNTALGLLQLKYIDQAIAQRKQIDTIYRQKLEDVKGICCLNDAGEKVANYAYFPILVDSSYPLSRDGLYNELKDNGIHARRYFYPLISNFPMYRGLPSANRDNLPMATMAAEQILCLPIYPDLYDEDVERIVTLISGGCL